MTRIISLGCLCTYLMAALILKIVRVNHKTLVSVRVPAKTVEAVIDDFASL